MGRDVKAEKSCLPNGEQEAEEEAKRVIEEWDRGKI